MTDAPTPRSIADELKSMLYPPLPGEAVDFAAQVDRFNELCRAAPPGAPDVTRAQNEMANHLLVLAESKQDKRLVKAALVGLLDSGRLGRQAACKFLRSGSISLEQLAPMVAGLPVRLRLHLLQELLRLPQNEEKTLLQWARQQISPLGEAPPKDVLSFLEACHRANDQLIHPVRRTILSGSFLTWLGKQTEGAMSAHDFSALCRAAHMLRHQPSVHRLALVLAEGRVPADVETVRLLASAGDQGSASLCKAFQHLLKSSDPVVALAGAEGLARIAWPKAGKGFALLLKRFPKQRARIAVKAATLPHACLMDLLRTLPGKAREEFAVRIFAAMARLAPDFLLSQLKKARALPPADAKVLVSFVNTQKGEALGGLKRRAMPPIPNGPVGLQKQGFVKRLFTEKKQTLDEVLEMVHSPKDKNLPGSEFSGALTSRNLSRLKLPGSYFNASQFIKVTFSAVDFSACGFTEADFTGCTFSNCDFTGAVFSSTAFSGCEFKNCNFTDAAFEDCGFEDCWLDRCFFSGALLRNSSATLLRTRFTSFNLCQFQDTAFTSCRMKFTALAHSQFLSSTLDGVECFDCGFVHSQFFSTSLSSCAFARTTLESCSMLDATSDVGSFKQARYGDLLRRGAALEMKPVDPPKEALANAKPLLSVIDMFSRRLEIVRAHTPLLLNNQRRLEHSARRMAGEDCFWLVPYLLQSDIVDQRFKIGTAPPCRIEGYTPSYTAMTLAEQYFKGIAPMAPTSSPVVILGLYAMGSLGSVAQTRSSDVDYWVCYDPATATPEKIAGLRTKLDAITDWAMETFELEAYFFLMSMEDVRRNEFGFSDKESSGSAQAILLKEEFYRTVVPVAGQHPLWWVTPPGASMKAKDAWARAAATMPREGSSRFVDMGHLTPIPPEEFFGACLWQIVKSLHSPYKSVMKLGLLEKYAGAPKKLMLADRIKRDLVRSRCEVQHVDPYVVLFREIRDFYRDQGDKETVLLLTEALLLKAKVGDFDFFFGFPSVFEEDSLLHFLFGAREASEARVRSLGQKWSFAKSLQIGATVSRFMTASYKRIQTTLGASTKARITPEDMTRLGRQIGANFARKRYKIMRVPFLGTKGYPELRFSAEKAPGKKTTWLVQGRTKGEGKRSVKDTEPLHRAADPITLMVWLVMNRLFTPRTLVDGESSIAPLSVVDIKNALQQLYDFFNYDDVFELEPDDYLGDELVTRAMLLVNLATPPEATRIEHVFVVYATSHGEVFSMPCPKPDATLMKSARAWLSKTLPLDASRIQDLKAVYPKRGQCPRIPGI